MKRPVTIGFLGHVDAGKTTLIESLLRLKNGSQKKNQPSKFLDTDSIEKRRGLTIFSKEARIHENDQEYILIDTPGHQDFAPEVDRILSIIDMAVLLIDSADGPVPFTKTLWKLLEKEEIPVLFVVNKIDQQSFDKSSLLSEITEIFGDRVVDFNEESSLLKENLAMASPLLMEKYFKDENFSLDDLKSEIQKRRIFPLFWTSATDGKGIQDFFQRLICFSEPAETSSNFQAMVYKISYDDKGTKLSHIRLFGGKLKNKESIEGEKIHEIRLYDGEKYQRVQEIRAGELATLVGPTNLKPGQKLGMERNSSDHFQPVFRYQLERKDGGSFEELLSFMKKVEDILPEIQAEILEDEKKIQFFAMGAIFLEVLEEKLEEQGISVSLSPGKILYKESVESPVLGVGHFEPLGHYSEVHLLLEPNSDNSGKIFSSAIKVDANKESIIHTIEEAVMEELPGVLIGAPLTDIKITLLSFKESAHSQAQDFRQASHRAIRQGLMEGNTVLLEPEISFHLALPMDLMGRTYQELSGLSIEDLEQEQKGNKAYFTGRGPASAIMEYFSKLPQRSRGKAQIDLYESGYIPALNAEEVIEEEGYDPLKDPDFPSASIFCSHGSGFSVPWYQVKEMASLPLEKIGREDIGSSSIFSEEDIDMEGLAQKNARRSKKEKKLSIGQDEIKKIFQQTFYANSDRAKAKKRKALYQEQKERKKILQEKKNKARNPKQNKPDSESWLLVDGYNILHEWPGIKDHLDENFDQARDFLVNRLSEFSALIDSRLIVVFDAYKVKGGKRSIQKVAGINVVFTREVETADEYIEKLTHEKRPNDQVIIATSDAPIQLIAFKEGALILSAREFIALIESSRNKTLIDFKKTAPSKLTRKIFIPDEIKQRPEDKEEG